MSEQLYGYVGLYAEYTCKPCLHRVAHKHIPVLVVSWPSKVTCPCPCLSYHLTRDIKGRVVMEQTVRNQGAISQQYNEHSPDSDGPGGRSDSQA